MPLDSTAVTIADDGTETLPSDSMASAIYSGIKASVEAAFGPFQTGSAGAAALRGIAATANGIAAGVVSDIKANADVVIGTGVSGLQKSTSLGTPTSAPDTEQTITGGIN